MINIYPKRRFADKRNYSETITIPAKAFLFGEYAVLFHTPALAVTFRQHFFEMTISIQLSLQHTSGRIDIYSSFFKDEKISFNQKVFFAKNQILEDEVHFFFNLLFPWRYELNGKNVSIHILNSFSPALGFGSSSALISGINYLLSKIYFAKIFSEEKLSAITWLKARKSLLAIQNKGSGYDIAVQLASCTQNKETISTLEFWKYANSMQKKNSETQRLHLHNDNIKQMGCFVKTGIYSDTKNKLTQFFSSSTSQMYADEHGQIADDIWKNICFDGTLNQNFLLQLNEVFSKANKIALKQGLFPIKNECFLSLQERLNKDKIPFKPMGAGHGDCLWVLATRVQLTSLCAIPSSNISFAFEDIVTSES